MTEQDKFKNAAVYVPWGTFKNALDRLAVSIPNRIDKTVYPGLNAAVVNQLLSGFRFLGLIDEAGKPMPALETVTVGDEAKRKKNLGDILRRQYADLFALDLVKTTPAELNEKMESLGVSGDTTAKAVRFFLAATEYLDIPVSTLFDKKKVSPNGKRKRPASKGREPDPRPAIRPNIDSGSSRVIELSSGGTLTISASMNYLALSPDDRKFFSDLIDRLDEYEKAAGNKTAW